MSIRFMFAAGIAAALCAAPAALAQTASAPQAVADAPGDASPIDPARLAAATQTADFVFPAGTYARMMDRTLNGMMKPMMDSVGRIPLRDLAAMTGADEAQLARIGEGKLEEVMAILDPAYKERMTIGVPAMVKAMQGMITEFEPTMKGGLARAYARRFDAGQLAELNAFFSTPTGKLFAENSMLVFTDPEIMNTMQAMVPMMMKRMPAIVKSMETEMARFPKRRKIEDLTPAERQKLDALLGTPEKDSD